MVVDNSVVLVGIALMLFLFMYMKISKFWGSLMMMVTGVGMMYMETTHSWIGFLVLATGFILIIYGFLGEGKSGKKYYRRRR